HGEHVAVISYLEMDGVGLPRGKSRACERVGNRLADVWEQHVRTMDAENRLDVRQWHAFDPEYASLRRLDQEQRFVAGLGSHGDGQHALEDALLYLLAAAAQADLNLRRWRFLERERLRRTRVFERQVLDVDLLDLQRRSGGNLRFGHADSWLKSGGRRNH